LGYIGLAALTACGKAEDQTGKDPVQTTVKQPADSLVLTNGAGAEVWLTLAREAKGADGVVCVERGLEVRRGASRVKVPLLYTGNVPVLLNDSTIRAILWTHCTPGAPYLVNLRSGHPVRDRPKAAP
jgi:hypothetical protein